MVPPSALDEALARDGVSKEVPCSALKGETVPDSLPASEGDQPWDFFGGNDAKVETLVLWPPHAKS